MIPDINLLPKSKKVVQKKGSFAKLFIILLIVAILIFYAINYYLVHRDIQDVKGKTDQLSAQIAEQQAELDQLNNTPEATLAQSIEFAEKYQTPVSTIIDVAKKYITGSGELAGLDYTDKSVTFTLYFDNLNEASTYVRNLKNEAIFETVELQSASAFTEVDVDNVEDETDLEGSAQYKAIIVATLDEKELKSGGEK
ncbi:MAG: hypothetical protein KBT36_11005 [Kurthia sp.]|nr:hypothetical protein [Candidatus Kurthia equi]